MKQSLSLVAEGDGANELGDHGAVSGRLSDWEELIAILRRFGAAAETPEKEGFDKSSGELVDALGWQNFGIDLYRCTVHSVVYLINTPTNAQEAKLNNNYKNTTLKLLKTNAAIGAFLKVLMWFLDH